MNPEYSLTDGFRDDGDRLRRCCPRCSDPHVTDPIDGPLWTPDGRRVFDPAEVGLMDAPLICAACWFELHMDNAHRQAYDNE